MKKNYLYTALGLMGIMGTLSIGVVSADTGCWEGKGTVPTSTYSSGIIYGCDDITNPGKSIPIITIYGKNGNNEDVGITIKAMNEGAVNIGITAQSFGSYYQWGNIYPFSKGTKVVKQTISAEGYGPNTQSGYYNDSTARGNVSMEYWDNSNNNNLWGGSGDLDNGYGGFDTGSFMVFNAIDRKGMCDTGYHIPSIGEWRSLLYLYGNNYDEKNNTDYFNFDLDSITIDDSTISSFNYPYNFANDLMMPFAGQLAYLGSCNTYPETNDCLSYNSNPARYFSSSAVNLSFSAVLFINPSAKLIRTPAFPKAGAGSIRCFKNSYVKLAPSTFTITFTGSGQGSISTGSIEVEELTSISLDDGAGTVTISGTVVATGIANEGYVFSGWLTDCGATVTASCSFTGEFKPITYSVHFTGTDVSGTMANQEFTYGVTGALTANAFTKTGYTFSGWSDGTTGYTNGQEVSNLTTTGGAIVTLTAEWNPNTYTVKFDAGEGNGTMNDQEFTYDVAQNLTGNTFTRDGYTFSGWTDGITAYTDKQNVKNLTGTSGAVVNLTAQWKQNTPSGGSSSGGGSSGGGSRRATTTDDSKLPGTTVNNNENSKDNSSVDSQNNNTQGKTYSDEFKRAYEFAYKNGITTMDTIEKAEMDKPLTRIAMAKMLSYYAINILGKKPANIVVPNFSDVSDKMDEEYDNGVTLAYQLGIMGINMPNNKFRPNDLVTRAEFGTALSRMLFGIADGKDKYYSTHLAKLMEEKIITNDDPNLQELRGYVMIMLMRSTED